MGSRCRESRYATERQSKVPLRWTHRRGSVRGQEPGLHTSHKPQQDRSDGQTISKRTAKQHKISAQMPQHRSPQDATTDSQVGRKSTSGILRGPAWCGHQIWTIGNFRQNTSTTDLRKQDCRRAGPATTSEMTGGLDNQVRERQLRRRKSCELSRSASCSTLGPIFTCRDACDEQCCQEERSEPCHISASLYRAGSLDHGGKRDRRKGWQAGARLGS